MPNDVSEIRRTIGDYIDLVESDSFTPEERLARLPGALDSLAVVIRDITYDFGERDYPDDPDENYQAIYQVVGRRFPTLGYYNIPVSITQDIGESKMGVGDGIDDIVDILLDLKGVLWRFKNTSLDDALWDLKQSFESHWGWHLRGLQLYLHVLKFGVEDESSPSTNS
jgi:Domain of unknown function (DUF5063)